LFHRAPAIGSFPAAGQAVTDCRAPWHSRRGFAKRIDLLAAVRPMSIGSERRPGMDDEPKLDIEDFHVEEIQQLLASQGQAVSLEQAQMIANFVTQAGGLDHALAVLDELRRERSAA
jgi:hypothetical protein